MEEEEMPLLSEEEMNKLGAKLVKAEIMGNTVRLLLGGSYLLNELVYFCLRMDCSGFSHGYIEEAAIVLPPTLCPAILTHSLIVLTGDLCSIHTIFYIFLRP